MTRFHPIRNSAVAVALVAAALLSAAPAAQAQDEAPAPAVQVELAFGTGVDRATRTLEGEATVFAAADFPGETGQIFCLSHIVGAAAPTTVTHVWYHEGTTMAKVDLNVGSGDWRTWSSKRVLPAWTGAWEVKVLDADGMVLASAGFEIQ